MFSITQYTPKGCKESLKKKNIKVFDHGRTRTCNLPLRRRTRYPLRHAAIDVGVLKTPLYERLLNRSFGALFSMLFFT